MKKTVLATAVGLTLGLSGPATANEALDVVVTIKPVHSIAAAVMGGAGTPKLLLEGATSPHSYALKPSDARNLSAADVVVRVDEGLETFLIKPIESLSSEARVVTLSKAPEVKLLPIREGGAFEEHAHDHGDGESHGHEHEHDHGDKHAHKDDHDHSHDHSHDHDHDKAKAGEHKHDEHAHDHEAHAHDKDGHAHDAKASEAGHAHGAHDPHIWLSPANAAAMADHLASVFAELRPDEAERFKANAESFKGRLQKLEADLKETLAPVKDKPFIVFHDAYQYFEDQYGLQAAGSITLSPAQQVGASRIKEIREKIQEASATCVFSEPQFEPKLVETVTEGTDASSGVLDPLGAELEAGPDQYFQLMTNLGESLTKCLGASS